MNINPTSVRDGTYSQIFEGHRITEKMVWIHMSTLFGTGS